METRIPNFHDFSNKFDCFDKKPKQANLQTRLVLVKELVKRQNYCFVKVCGSNVSQDTMALVWVQKKIQGRVKVRK